MIQKAFALPAEVLTTITMVQNGRMPIVEVDGYPPNATARTVAPGLLPPGNALVTLAVERWPDVPFLTRPSIREGPLYHDCRVATVRGPAGELLELVECFAAS